VIYRGWRILMSIKTFFATALLLGTTISVYAADAVVAPASKPAVDGFNGKLSFGGLYESTSGNNGYFYADSSFSVPLGERFGAQVDTALAINGNVTAGGVGAHVFWRDPSYGLIGGYGEIVYSSSGSPSIYRFGAESEAYIDRFSIEAFAGVQDAKTIKPIFTGDLTLAFYPVDDLRLSASIVRNFDETSGVIGLEYGFQNGGTTQPVIFANAEFGEDTTTVKAGLRLYFGQSSKSLIQRHREDDPRNRIQFGGVQSAGSSGTPPLTPEQQCDADGGFWLSGDNFCIFPK
jgi:hypothetical protein